MISVDVEDPGFQESIFKTPNESIILELTTPMERYSCKKFKTLRECLDASISDRASLQKEVEQFMACQKLGKVSRQELILE